MPFRSGVWKDLLLSKIKRLDFYVSLITSPLIGLEYIRVLHVGWRAGVSLLILFDTVSIVPQNCFEKQYTLIYENNETNFKIVVTNLIITY